jgi:polyribonucleotide nucleotidyltransferase
LEPDRTWWKSDSRITKATGTTIVINEDPITEEGVIEILELILELKQYWLKLNQSLSSPQTNESYEVKKVIKMLGFCG